MAGKRQITRDDIRLKARMLAEGVRLDVRQWPFESKIYTGDTPALQNENFHVNCADPIGILKQFEKLDTYGTSTTALGDAFIFDGCSISAPIISNPGSTLSMIVNNLTAEIRENGKTLMMGKIYSPRIGQPWSAARLSNGISVNTVIPGMSASIINVLFNLACNNFNSGKACRYCGLFSNPISRKMVDLPIDTLKEFASLIAEAVKIITDSGWRGMLALTGGALSPEAQKGYLDRMKIVLEALRRAIDDKVWHQLIIVYNHYPPRNFADMYEWKKIGINHTSIDLEVVDGDEFARLCPGKTEYAPYKFWKESLVASTEVFGRLNHTSTNLVIGIEPMDRLIEGCDELLSMGVLPIPLTFIPDPHSAMAETRVPGADWLVESSDRLNNLFSKYGMKFIPAYARDLLDNVKYALTPASSRKDRGYAPSLWGSYLFQSKLTHLTVIFDEMIRRYQRIIPGFKYAFPTSPF